MLMHCKSGADRAGMMSVLYRFLHEGVPLAGGQARAVAASTATSARRTPASSTTSSSAIWRTTPLRPMPFFDWVDTVYDPDELKRTFQSQGWANRLVDSVLRRE